MSSIKNSLGWSFTSNYLNIIIRFFSVAITARLLTPDEIGIFSIGLAGFGFLQIFRDFGISAYIVQRKSIDSTQLGAAFTVSLAICWTLALIAFLASDFIGAFYERAEVTEIFRLLAINLVIIPFGTLNLSVLKRKLMFKQVAIIDFFSALTGSISVIIFAYLGYSYYSLAFGSIMGCIATVIGSNMFRQPELPFLPGIKGLKEVLGFGSVLSVSNIMTQIDAVGPELILGKVYGMQSVAFFNKGGATANLFDRLILKSVTAISGAYFADYHRTSQLVLKNAFLKMQDYVVVISWNFFIFLSIYSLDIVRFLYGDQWDFSAQILPYFCFAVAINSMFSLFDQLLINTGHIKLQLSIVYKTMFLKIGLVAYATTQNIETAAMILMIVPLVKILMIQPALRQVIKLELPQLMPKLRIWFSIAAIFAVCELAFRQLMLTLAIQGLPELMLAAFFSLFLWVGLVFVFKHPIRNEIAAVCSKVTRKLS
ncbi:oligosaccharide flippase family protein [Neptunicella sp. SCSIO 80796]|uniref:oligosaccharide flippase family protein n=1 Tax=Neptunicella plasticusilytica TaxID=3117012 RepID=UPI003A4DD022